MIEKKTKCIFLDRDGVLMADRPDYVYLPEHYRILPGVVQAIQLIKRKGFLVVVITNQAGISRGLYSRAQMDHIHNLLQQDCNNQIDHFYFSPYHPSITESLSRKPGRLLFEKAIARYNIDPDLSWMVGDRVRDLIPAQALGIKTVLIGEPEKSDFKSDVVVESLFKAMDSILIN